MRGIVPTMDDVDRIPWLFARAKSGELANMDSDTVLIRGFRGEASIR